MSGIHFYSHTQLQRSLCGWICSKFTTRQISNAEHDDFLSIIQAFGTFWAPAFDERQRRDLVPEDPGLFSVFYLLFPKAYLSPQTQFSEAAQTRRYPSTGFLLSLLSDLRSASMIHCPGRRNLSGAITFKVISWGSRSPTTPPRPPGP